MSSHRRCVTNIHHLFFHSFYSGLLLRGKKCCDNAKKKVVKASLFFTFSGGRRKYEDVQCRIKDNAVQVHVSTYHANVKMIIFCDTYSTAKIRNLFFLDINCSFSIIELKAVEAKKSF